MKRPRIPSVFAVAVGLAVVVAVALAAPQGTISRDVFGGGGGHLGGSLVMATGTFGQPAVGTLAREGVVLRSGFWQPAGVVVAVPGLEIPQRPALFGNTPNPFNPATEISFTVGATTRHARLQVYDLRGMLVCTVVDGDVAPGVTRVMWRGDDRRGAQVCSGVYFYRLQVGNEAFTQKMMLLK